MSKKDNSKNNENNEVFRYDDHKKPMTRRDFMAASAKGIGALALTSGAASLLTSNNAFGAALNSCGENLLCGGIPFLCIDGAGGMNIAGGNALVGFAANQLQEDFGKNILSHYRRLGVPDDFHPSVTGQVNSSMGLKFHTTSGILEGMNEVLGPTEADPKDLREYVDGAILCGITNDDTNGNPINTTYMAQKVGAIGELVQIIGSSNSVSGGNSASPPDQINLMLKPSQLTSFRSSESLLSIGDSLVGDNLINTKMAGGGSRMKNFMNLLSRAGKGRLEELQKNRKIASQIEDFHARQGKVLGVFDKFSPSELNPTQNNADKLILEKTYGKMITAFSSGEQTSSNLFNLLTRRTAGAATLTVGGCDYHNGSAMTGHSKDREIGRHIGHAIRMAYLRNRPIFIHLFTDGGVVGDAAGQVDPALPSRVVWRSDDGPRSAALMIVFNPNKKRIDIGNNEHSNFLLTKRTRQIGYFKEDGGNVTDAHSLSNNVSKLWMGIILNYMATLENTTDEDKLIQAVGEKFLAKFGSLPPDWKELIRFKSLVA